MITTSSGKNLGTMTNAHVFIILYKLITGIKESDGLSVGFHHDKNQWRINCRAYSDDDAGEKSFASSYMKDVFGFAEYPKNATYGLG